jgi:hypothetical protein
MQCISLSRFTAGGHMPWVAAIPTALAFPSSARHKANPRQSSIARTNKARGRVGSSVLSWLILALAGTLAIPPAYAVNCLTINPMVNAADFQGSGVNPADVINAMTYVSKEYCDLYSDPMTVDITVKPDAGVDLGHSQDIAVDHETYSAFQSFLTTAFATHRSDLASLELANLKNFNPPTQPFFIARSEEVALGILSNSTITSGTFLFNPKKSYSFDSNNRPTTGFDFLSVAEHEVSEILGRSAGLNAGGSNGLTVLDMYRFTAPNVRSFDNTGEQNTGAYFSLHQGTTRPKDFNVMASLGDLGDWKGTSNPQDTFDAKGGAGALVNSNIDPVVMDALGYHLSPNVHTNVFVDSASLGPPDEFTFVLKG